MSNLELVMMMDVKSVTTHRRQSEANRQRKLELGLVSTVKNL